MRSHVEKATACPGGLLMGLRSASQSDSLLGSELPGAPCSRRGLAVDWGLCVIRARAPCVRQTERPGRRAWSHVAFEMGEVHSDGTGRHLVVMQPGDAFCDRRVKPSGFLRKSSFFEPRVVCKSCQRKGRL